MYDSLKFSITTPDNEDHDVWLVVMDSSVPPRFEPTIIKANARLGIWSVNTYAGAHAAKGDATWHVGRLSTVLGNPRFTINGVALHVTGPEDAPRIQARFNNGTELEELALLSETGAITMDPEETIVGPQICPVAIAAGSGGGRRDGGEIPGSGGGGGHSHVHTPLLTPREELAEKPKSPFLEDQGRMQFVPTLSSDTPSVRITAEDGDRRVEIEITNPGGVGRAAELAAEHIVKIVAALGGAKANE